MGFPRVVHLNLGPRPGGRSSWSGCQQSKRELLIPTQALEFIIAALVGRSVQSDLSPAQAVKVGSKRVYGCIRDWATLLVANSSANPRYFLLGLGIARHWRFLALRCMCWRNGNLFVFACHR